MQRLPPFVVILREIHRLFHDVSLLMLSVTFSHAMSSFTIAALLIFLFSLPFMTFLTLYYLWKSFKKEKLIMFFLTFCNFIIVMWFDFRIILLTFFYFYSIDWDFPPETPVIEYFASVFFLFFFSLYLFYLSYQIRLKSCIKSSQVILDFLPFFYASVFWNVFLLSPEVTLLIFPVAFGIPAYLIYKTKKVAVMVWQESKLSRCEK